MAGLANGCPLSVSAYPVAWRIETVNDGVHRGFDYVRSEDQVTSLLPERPTDPARQLLLGRHGDSLGSNGTRGPEYKG